MDVLAVIIARGGSKKIPGKNMRLLCGRPLIYYTLRAANESRLVTRIVLSTDDREIADYARRHGTEVPFIRPDDLARDDTPTVPVIQHVLEELEKSEGYSPEIVVVLQPTSPLRQAVHVDNAIHTLLQTKADSVVTVREVPHEFNPVSIMRIEQGELVPYLQGEGTRLLRRQDKPKVYARNGVAVYATRCDVILKEASLFGNHCQPLLMSPEDSVDIDDEMDLLLAELLISKLQTEKAGRQ